MVRSGTSFEKTERRRQILGQLAARGLVRRRRGARAAASIFSGAAPATVRLRAALEALGPLFAAFAAYLATRVDLLPLPDCFELAAVGNGGAPDDISSVRALLRQECGEGIDSRLPLIEPEAFRHTRAYQWHRGALGGGEELVVKVVRPSFREQAEREADLLAVLEEAEVPSQDGTWLDVREALRGFVDGLRVELDLRNEAKALERLAREARSFDIAVVAASHGDCVGRSVIATERLSGESLETADPKLLEEFPRRLCQFWLQQSLFGTLSPVGPFAENLVVLPDGRPGICGGSVVALEPRARRDLLHYLTAVARHDPDQACALLLRETAGAGAAVARDEMRRRFRQAEPFRTAGWSDHYAGQRLADMLFIQLRLVRQGDYRPRPHLIGFFQALFGLERIARRFGPERDSLREGLEDVRVVGAAVRLREHFGPARLQENLERYLGTAMEVMRAIDGALVNEGDTGAPGGGDRGRGGPCREDRTNGWPVVVGTLLMLAALALVTDRLAAAGTARVWLEGAGAAAFAGLGALLLFYVARVGRGRL